MPFRNGCLLHRESWRSSGALKGFSSARPTSSRCGFFRSPKGHRRCRFRGHDVADFMPSTNVAAVPMIGTVKRKSIFRNDSQKLDSAFIEAGLPEKVLLVPLDWCFSAILRPQTGNTHRNPTTTNRQELRRQKKRFH